MTDRRFDNDATVKLLVEQAVNHARAGADVVAPSGMMDGTVEALRRGLDSAGFQQVAILAYSVKYASAFYGPFRDAADSAPQFGDRKAYQMDPRAVSRRRSGKPCSISNRAPIMVMVKPGMPVSGRPGRRQEGGAGSGGRVSGQWGVFDAGIGRESGMAGSRRGGGGIASGTSNGRGRT